LGIKSCRTNVTYLNQIFKAYRTYVYRNYDLKLEQNVLYCTYERLRQVAKPWFDSRCGSTSLCPWERHLMLFPTLGPISQLFVVVQPDERHANRTVASVLGWYDRHRA